jgi:hypothetical protein
LICRSIFIISSLFITILISYVSVAPTATASGSLLIFWKASRLGASITRKLRCSFGTDQAPTILTLYFLDHASILLKYARLAFLFFSLFMGQFSGVCLEINKNVGIALHSRNCFFNEIR